jgi:hypothetical protein
MHDAYRQRETAFATVMEDRADWDRATRRQRQLAVAADGELRRRHPAEPWPPLRSAEPAAAEAENNDPPVAEDMARRITDLAARHREFADRLAARQSLMIPAEDPDFGDLGPAFPSWKGTERGAILRPPPPEIIPFERLMEGVAGRDMDMEAGT